MTVMKMQWLVFRRCDKWFSAHKLSLCILRLLGFGCKYFAQDISDMKGNIFSNSFNKSFAILLLVSWLPFWDWNFKPIIISVSGQVSKIAQSARGVLGSPGPVEPQFLREYRNVQFLCFWAPLISHIAEKGTMSSIIRWWRIWKQRQTQKHINKFQEKCVLGVGADMPCIYHFFCISRSLHWTFHVARLARQYCGNIWHVSNLQQPQYFSCFWSKFYKGSGWSLWGFKEKNSERH